MKKLIKNVVTTPYLIGESGDEFIQVSVLIEGNKIAEVKKR